MYGKDEGKTTNTLTLLSRYEYRDLQPRTFYYYQIQLRKKLEI
jgi:hypothetical protein